MTTNHTNLALVEGEVHILIEPFTNFEDIQIMSMPFFHNGQVYQVLASTAKIEGIPQLDRKHFVKPKVDVGYIANKFARRQEFFPYSSDAYTGFLAGYNFKEAEFTFNDLIRLWMLAGEDLSFDEALNKLRPLSLPKSVTLNENNELISVEW